MFLVSKGRISGKRHTQTERDQYGEFAPNTGLSGVLRLGASVVCCCGDVTGVVVVGRRCMNEFNSFHTVPLFGDVLCCARPPAEEGDEVGRVSPTPPVLRHRFNGTSESLFDR